MRFLFAAFLGLIVFASALSTAATTVYNDITSLDHEVLVLINDLNSYQGGLVAATPLVAQLTAVHLATRHGYVDSFLLSSPLNPKDATALIDHVEDTLAVDNPHAVAILKTKKPLFDAIGVSPAIVAGLQVLLDDHLDFSNVVLAKLPAAQVDRGRQVVDIITKALQSGIKYYSTVEG